MNRLFIAVGLFSFMLFSMGGVCHSQCEGDITCDGVIDGSDLAMLAADFGTTGCGTCDDVASEIDELKNRIAQLEELLAGVTRSADHTITFSGVNVQIVNGQGRTDTTNDLGNLIVGYNEERGDHTDARDGSHNIVVGTRHAFSSYGGIVVGYDNTILGEYSSISGGSNHITHGAYSSISGGDRNSAVGAFSSVTGGQFNIASGDYSVVIGWTQKNAVNPYNINPIPGAFGGWQ